MPLKIITVGSKALDDVAAYSKGKIENLYRIVEINPKSLCSKNPTELQPEAFANLYNKMKFFNDYSRKVFEIEFERKLPRIIEGFECGFVLYDFSIVRRPLHVFSLDDDRNVLLTENQTLNENINLIRDFIEKNWGIIQYENTINMFLQPDDYLEKVIRSFEEVLTSNANCRALFLDVRFAQHFISKDGTLELFSDQKGICYSNKYFARLLEYHNKLIYSIPMPQKLYSDERIRPAGVVDYSVSILKYFENALLELAGNNVADPAYHIKRFDVIEASCLDEIMLKPLAFLVNRCYGDRKIILIGQSYTLANLLEKKYGIRVFKSIEYNGDESEEILLERLREISGLSNEFFCVVPILFNTILISALWKSGYGYRKGYVSTVYTPYVMKNFIGEYDDFYGNHLISTYPIDIEIRGCGNVLRLNKMSKKSSGNMRILMFSGINIEIKDISILSGDVSIRLYDGAYMSIGDKVTFCGNNHIRGSFNSTTFIDDETIIGEDSVFFNGDGHAIIDLNEKRNQNYSYKRGEENKHLISVGKSVYIHKNCFLLAGTVIGDSCIVENDSLINKEFGYGKHIAGKPATEVS